MPGCCGKSPWIFNIDWGFFHSVGHFALLIGHLHSLKNTSHTTDPMRMETNTGIWLNIYSHWNRSIQTRLGPGHSATTVPWDVNIDVIWSPSLSRILSSMRIFSHLASPFWLGYISNHIWISFQCQPQCTWNLPFQTCMYIHVSYIHASVCMCI